MALINSGRVAVNGFIQWDVVTPEAQTALQIGKVEISNVAEVIQEIGWGEELTPIIGVVDTGVFTPITLPYTFAAGEQLAIISPKKFDILQVVNDTVATPAVTLGVYDGSDMVTETVVAAIGTLDFDVDTTSEALIEPINAWVRGGIAGFEGMYCMLSDDAEDLEISAVRIGRVIDFVTTVAAGNHAYREYALEPLKLQKEMGLFAYRSVPGETVSIATIDYAQI
jgi:hypothetical protein